MSRIDVIVPVYRGAAETRACIESVLAANNTQSAEIVVMNDASPDPVITAYLADLAKSARITLVTNESNLGFVATCNRAMQLHAERDVVLLNSDTVVGDGWLDRMAACAAATPQTASVTPFSNNATLCSYPRLAVSNEMSAALPLRDLDAMFAITNAGRSVEIPTGVGFCMLMTRVAINAIGIFDVEAFGRGYGEENDWCMRATAQGFAHQLCGDVFVYHKGEVSFGSDASAGKQHAQAMIDARYPAYRELISRHLEDDPARMLRRRIDLARLAVSTRPRVLLLAPNLGGGIERHVNELAVLLSDSLEVLVLKPYDEQSMSLRWARQGEEFEAFFEDRQNPGELLGLLCAVGISRVHLHHVHGLPAYVLDLHGELGVPLDITLHDYFPVTQRYRLSAGGSLESSGEAAANDWGLSDTQWRQRMDLLLGAAERVIAPSYDLAQRMKEYFPDIAFQVHNHPDLVVPPKTVPYKVLILGALTIEKGLKVAEACALDARARKLPLFFKLIGHTAESVAKFPDVPLVIGGTYREEDLEQLIALEKADAFLFPSQIPKSYSYTLAAALRTNLPIIASALGAFNERLAANPRAHTVLWDAAASVWNDALLAAIDDQHQPQYAQTSDNEAQHFVRAYVSWYLEPISPSIPPTSSAADCSPLTVYAPKNQHPGIEHSLQKLFSMGVDCGNASALNELRRRSGLADGQIVSARNEIVSAREEIAKAANRIATLHRELDGLQYHLREMQSRLEVERDAARTAFDSVLSSTSWRITSPLRFAAAWARGKRAKFTETTDK